MIVLDHLILLSATGAPEAHAIVHLGLTEGRSNTHPGQGTANRRFFFQNAFLELVWVTDEIEARGETVRRTQLWERWAGRLTGACKPAVFYLGFAGMRERDARCRSSPQARTRARHGSND